MKAQTVPDSRGSSPGMTNEGVRIRLQRNLLLETFYLFKSPNEAAAELPRKIGHV